MLRERIEIKKKGILMMMKTTKIQNIMKKTKVKTLRNLIMKKTTKIQKLMMNKAKVNTFRSNRLPIFTRRECVSFLHLRKYIFR